MNKKYVVDLTDEERGRLQRLVRCGERPARTIRWAHALLKAAAGGKDQDIAAALDISLPTVQRLRARFVEEGLDAALSGRGHQPRPYRRRLQGAEEARLIALACSAPPAGRARWTLRLLADRLVELAIVESVSYQTVRRVLKKTS